MHSSTVIRGLHHVAEFLISFIDRYHFIDCFFLLILLSELCLLSFLIIWDLPRAYSLLQSQVMSFN